MDDILTAEQAARELGIAPEKVVELLMSADLAGRNIGGQWRTTKRALLTFIDGLGEGGCCGPGGCCPPAAAGAGRAPASPGWS